MGSSVLWVSAEVHLENEGAVVAGIENTGLISDTG
jgi:hypothetical protein